MSQKRCPINGKPGKPVQNQTIKALLQVSLRSVREVPYFFCPTQDCEVVYYSADGTQTFTLEDLSEVVYQKRSFEATTPICYCFQYSVGQVINATPTQRQSILSDIKEGITAGQCACDLRNPQGSCCLGNVAKLCKQFADS